MKRRKHMMTWLHMLTYDMCVCVYVDLLSWLVDEEKEAHNELVSYANVWYLCASMCKCLHVLELVG
jgi:hypothetical protein